MKIREITGYLETLAPLDLQEDYDNSGLLIGDPEWVVNKAMLTLDVSEEVLEEAVNRKCGLIISHHPMIFRGLKRLTGSDHTSRLAIRAVQNNIAVYSIHTNLDNSFDGLNKFLAEKIGLENLSVLRPATGILSKLVTFCPLTYADKVRNALFEAGAGHIGNYDACSFNMQGEGTFRGSEGANPFVGKKNVIHHEPEVRIEVLFPVRMERSLVSALKTSHPYEEVAYDIYPLSNAHPLAGSGITGEFRKMMSPSRFIKKVKSVTGIPLLRHTDFGSKNVKKVAICTGSGSFMIPDAIRCGADVLLTGDLKYHDFFDVQGRLILADIGHYESEQIVKEFLHEVLIRKFPTFAFLISETDTNPIKYN